MAGGKKVSTTVYMTVEQSQKLKSLNQKTKVPVAEFIREGIDLVLNKYQHLLPGQLQLTEVEEDASSYKRLNQSLSI